MQQDDPANQEFASPPFFESKVKYIAYNEDLLFILDDLVSNADELLKLV
jgi:hypothetical protein